MIFDIKRYTIHDGPGIRTTVFMKGCPLSCFWCHNPEGITRRLEIAYFEYKCIGCNSCVIACPLKAITVDEDGKRNIDRSICDGCGICAERCPTNAIKAIGRKISVDELIQEVERDRVLYDGSGGGVTFSGGEPLMQWGFLLECLKELKKRYIHTALDTSGYSSPEVLEMIIPYTDLFLYDIKLFDPEEHKKYTGVSNDVIKENLKLLSVSGKRVILRFPVIPNVTDTLWNVKGWMGFISKIQGLKEINLLPYHSVEEKYKRLNRPYRMETQEAPTKEILNWLKEEFESIGLKVKIGG